MWYTSSHVPPHGVPPTLIGYARISTGEQNLDLQIDALNQAGCEKVFTDEMSGIKAERPGLQEAVEFLRENDTLVVWRLDRLGRSLKDLMQRVEELQGRGIGFRSMNESIDTTSPVGKFQFHVARAFSALAEFERALIRERTIAGLRAARARGRFGGRKRQMSPEKVQTAATLMANQRMSIPEICKALGVSRSTLYRYVGPRGEIRVPQQDRPRHKSTFLCTTWNCGFDPWLRGEIRTEGMTLKIDHPDADKLAQELAGYTGETIPQAVIAALRERLERQKQARRGSLAKRPWTKTAIRQESRWRMNSWLPLPSIAMSFMANGTTGSNPAP